MKNLIPLAFSFFTVACVQTDALDTGDLELEASMEIHEGADAERSIQSVGTASESGQYELLTMASGNNCKGSTKVSDACGDLANDVLGGDSSSETCPDLYAECPSVGYPSHNRKVFDAIYDCTRGGSSDDHSSDGGVLGF